MKTGKYIQNNSIYLLSKLNSDNIKIKHIIRRTKKKNFKINHPLSLTFLYIQNDFY